MAAIVCLFESNIGAAMDTVPLFSPTLMAKPFSLTSLRLSINFSFQAPQVVGKIVAVSSLLENASNTLFGAL